MSGGNVGETSEIARNSHGRKFALDLGAGDLVSYSRLRAGVRGQDIVRELIGSVKPLREGRHPFPPPDVAIQLHRCKAVGQRNREKISRKSPLGR